MRKVVQISGDKYGDCELVRTALSRYGTITAVVYAFRELKTGMYPFYFALAYESACHFVNLKTLNKLRLIRGLCHEQKALISEADYKLAPPKLLMPKRTGEQPVADTILAEPIGDIICSTEYKKWTAPFKFKEHSIHPQIPQHRRTFIGSLIIGIALAIAATVITFGGGLVALPLWVGICFYVGAGLAMGKGFLAKRQLSALSSKIAPAPTVVESVKDVPAPKRESSYATILAPVMMISPSVSRASESGASSEEKGMPAVQEPENKMTINESAIALSPSLSPGQ